MSTFPLPQSAAHALAKLGRDLSLARRRRRLSQASLAERSGIGVNTVLERGEPGGSIEHLARILHVLGEIERFENLLDTGSDEVGLVLMDENLPERIRSRKTSGAM
jgi:transcriptional regulator with XRE-family HTH domain